MKKLIVATLLLGSGTLLSAQKTAKIPAYYKPAKSEMYHKGWIDFNKNGIKDIYEDPAATLDARIENLLQQMTLEEKTCQMVTLYGYKRERRHRRHRRTPERLPAMGTTTLGQ